MAVLAFVVVLGSLGGPSTRSAARASAGRWRSVTAAEAALKTIRTDLGQVFAPGRRPRGGRPGARRCPLLSDAYRAGGCRASRPMSRRRRSAPKSQVIGGLDRLFHVVPVAERDDRVLRPGASPVQHPGDDPGSGRDARTSSTRPRRRSTGSTFGRRRRRSSSRPEDEGRAATGGHPDAALDGGRDLLIVDDKNVVWRWRPADNKGNGHDADGQGPGRPRLGRRRRRRRHLPAGRQRGPLQPLRRRPVRTEHPGLHARPGRQRLPGRPPEPAVGRPRRVEGRGPADRRRHLRRRRRLDWSASSAARARAGRPSRRATRATRGTATPSCGRPPTMP